ncbi:oligoendopeptidase F [Robertmurraya sp. DFI.2.37]|uniref:oligoendopeptidase F n=1 Tax=Robertmurraya sp. DFI.2.37 TaxID=3031819 RepID=UPI0023DB7311|nr:oligoendopeptidase F [Robertmurraya sp. DFI.2.37]MDF1510306.1 oligoendopeptidase F [Robertmurraya sp. DFI.2.37]
MVKTMTARLKRDEVPINLTWKLEDLFASSTEWQAEIATIEKELPAFSVYKGKLHESSATLLACLELQEKLNKKLILVSTYASLLQSGDSTNPVNQANAAIIADLRSKTAAALSFIDSEIITIPEEKLQQFIDEEIGLKPFTKMLTDLIDGKKYRLSPETEEVLAALSDVHDSPYAIYQTSKLADMQFEPIIHEDGEELPNSFALFEDRYEFSPNTETRRRAYESFTKTLEQYKNTFATTYATEVKRQVTLSRLRNFDSVTDMLLYPQQVSKEMYENQLNIIQAELAPHMRRFAQLKKKILQLDELQFCDLKAPLDPEFNPKTSYEEASEVILEALRIMGPEYLSIMKKGLTERWVDRADNVGKATGAFCSSPYGSHPYILITWTDTMRGAFVLAHELGHAGHFYLANQNQRIMNTRPSTYFIEAPSTMNEMLLGDHLLSNTTDPQMKRWVVLQLLGTYYHNFVTHLLEGEFQRRVYGLAEKGTPLTAKILCETKRNVLSEFWGDTVTIDEGASLTWMRQPHYYMGLYPYTYSAGLTASTAMSQQIKKEGEPAVNRWLEVLKAGGTKKPIDLLKQAGIDMSKPDPIRKAVAYVGSLVDILEDSYK